MIVVYRFLIETLRNNDSIEEDVVLDNATLLSVSQCLNQNLKFFISCSARKLILTIFSEHEGLRSSVGFR